MAIDLPIVPTLARLENELPKRGNWVFEPKLDGFRGILVFDGRRSSVWSRNRKNLSTRFPELLHLAGHLPSCVLDGEIIATRDGKLDFEALQRRLVGNKEVEVSFVAFDLLKLDSLDLSKRPLTERRKQLEGLGEVDVIPQTDDRDAAGSWFDHFDDGIEGVVAKRADEPYRAGLRTWIKVKVSRTIDLVLGGITPAWGLLLGAHGPDGKLHHVGTTSPISGSFKDRFSLSSKNLQLSRALMESDQSGIGGAQTGSRTGGLFILRWCVK